MDIQRDEKGYWKKGQSGNPSGKPSHRSRLEERLWYHNYDAVAMMVDIALNAEDERNRTVARKSLFERICPALRSVELSHEEGAKFLLQVVYPENK